MKVIGRGVGVCFLMYCMAGVFGFLTFLDDTKDNILTNNYNDSPAVLVAASGLVINLGLSFPIYVNIIRQMYGT
eukprot:UN26348